MSLPRVHVKLSADGQPPEVWINDERVPSVLGVNVSGGAGDLPRVTMTVRPGELEIDTPQAGVQVLRTGPTATEFAAALSPARLEADALARLDDAATQGEAFAAAVAVQAAAFDDRG